VLTIGVTPELSVAVGGVHVATAVLLLPAVTTMLAGQFWIVGGVVSAGEVESTLMMKVQTW